MDTAAEVATADVQAHVPPQIERLGTLAELTQGIWAGAADVRLLAAS